MKNCDEMMENLFRRREKYVAERNKKRKMVICTASSMCCICLVSLLGFGIWKANQTNPLANIINHEMPIISSFGQDDLVASYPTPNNSDFYFSLALTGAMDEYGDEVLYRVFIDVFCDRELLSAESEQVKKEVERLLEYGYQVALEPSFDGISNQHGLIMEATLSELTEFAANENYGYFMFLYDERRGSSEGDERTPNRIV